MDNHKPHPSDAKKMIDAVLTNTVLPRMSHEFLQALADGRSLSSVELSAGEGDFREIRRARHARPLDQRRHRAADLALQVEGQGDLSGRP